MTGCVVYFTNFLDAYCTTSNIYHLLSSVLKSNLPQCYTYWYLSPIMQAKQKCGKIQFSKNKTLMCAEFKLEILDVFESALQICAFKCMKSAHF